MKRGARGRLPAWAIGLVVTAVTALAMLLAARRELPWSDGHELRAVFGQVQGMTTRSPVRIAGVEVGRVSSIEPLAGGGGQVLVTMELDPEALPVHTDATLKVRPRLFLEGNYFVDLRPGTPGAPVAEEGYTVPVSSTAAPVQLDQVLTTLRSDVRGHLRVLLDQLGNGLVREDGARGLRGFLRASGGAYRSTAVVNEALLGTAPHDLSDVITNLDRVVAALDLNERPLQELVGDVDATAGALAADARALERTVAELPGTIRAARPVLAALNGSLPAARAFAREALGGVEALPDALDAGTPLLRQARGLLSARELRGDAAELRPVVPALARLTERTLPFLDQARGLASCFNEVVIPWANSTVPDPETPATGRIFEETSYGLVGIAGESRSADANGPYARVLGGTGANLIVMPPLDGASDETIGVSPLPILGARPAVDSSAKTPFRPDAACEEQEPPDLDSGDDAELGGQSPLAVPRAEVTPELRSRLTDLSGLLDRAEAMLGGDASGAKVRRSEALSDEALDGLDRVLARALGWEALLDLPFARERG